MKNISVIICCYNSATRLLLVLEYLSRQETAEDFNWEIIVVDNNCIDNTAAIALEHWRKYGLRSNLSVVKETKSGLCYAREAGVKAALYDIIIFCDDDNLLAPNYLNYAHELVTNTAAKGYKIWGGKINAYFDKETEVPEWFENEKSNYVVGKQAEQTGDISARGFLWGAGMVILKEAFTYIINKKFPILLKDRTGDILSSGGDSEICLRILIAGYKLYYDENLVLQHYVTKNKLTPSYNASLIKGFIDANTILNKYKIFIYYVSDKNFLNKQFYRAVYFLKHALNKYGIRCLTTHDTVVLHALFCSELFKDSDFDLMRRLLKEKIDI